MNRTIQIAPVRKSVVVDASPSEAFEFFTAKIDRWWPRAHHLGSSPPVAFVIEPYAGGRWYSRHEDGSEVVVGHVRVWRPGEAFVVSWEISAEWKPEPRAQYASEVDVRFFGESGGRTRVEVEHRDFEKMESGGDTMRDGVDEGWPGILALYMECVSARAAA